MGEPEMEVAAWCLRGPNGLVLWSTGRGPEMPWHHYLGEITPSYLAKRIEQLKAGGYRVVPVVITAHDLQPLPAPPSPTPAPK